MMDGLCSKFRGEGAVLMRFFPALHSVLPGLVAMERMYLGVES
jgi:hypothetical protein